MRYIRCKFDPNTETVLVNGETIEQAKYWKTQEGVDDVNGYWDSTKELFIPDGFYDLETGFLNLS